MALIPATTTLLNADRRSPHALGEGLGVDVPATWPPDLYDDDAIRWTLQGVESGRCPVDWCTYYFTQLAEPPRSGQLIGVGGFKGAPDENGVVELGYSIVSDCRRQGFAREAVDGLLGWAFADARVTRVIAHTLAELVASIGVLRSAGFTLAGAGSDPSEPSAIQYALNRVDYERSLDRRAAFTIEPS